MDVPCILYFAVHKRVLFLLRLCISIINTIALTNRPARVFLYEYRFSVSKQRRQVAKDRGSSMSDMYVRTYLQGCVLCIYMYVCMYIHTHHVRTGRHTKARPCFLIIFPVSVSFFLSDSRPFRRPTTDDDPSDEILTVSPLSPCPPHPQKRRIPLVG
jgi:hypothetical protein